MLTRIGDFDAKSVSVYKSKGGSSSFPNYYLQANNKPIEIQSEWLTLGKFPLPGKKFLSDDSKNMNLTIELDVIGSVIYQKLDTIDEYMKANPVCDKNYHALVRRDEEKQRVYLKFKVYLDTALYDKDRNRIPITSLHDFYQYLKEDKKIRIVFAFSKMWKMSNEYGFSLSARRVQLSDNIENEPQQEKPSFI